MDAWQSDRDAPANPGRPGGSGTSNLYWWLAENMAMKFAQGSICTSQNIDQCGGDMSKAPWRPGMPMSGLPMSELPDFPNDAYYSEKYGEWIDSNDRGVNWRPYYANYCDQL